MSKEIALYGVNDIRAMADAFAKSKLFGMATIEQAMALCLIAQAEGQHPALAARDYHIIQGKATLKADAMMARFQAAGGKIQWEEVSDNRVAATFSHAAGGSIMIDWTMERAKKAGLGGKDMWTKYPRQMLRSRVVSEGIRTVFPGVVIGVYTPEEIQDFDDNTVKQAPNVHTIEAQATQVSESFTIHGEDVNAEYAARGLPFASSQDRKIFMQDIKDKLSKIESEDEISSLLDEHGWKFDHLGATQKNAMNELFVEARKQFC